MDRDGKIRAGIEQHWTASERATSRPSTAMYAVDAILDYPQSGERFRGRSTIQAQRGGHPAERHFEVLRIRGGGDLWVSECIITYDGVPTYTVSIMEFADELVDARDPVLRRPISRAARRTRGTRGDHSGRMMAGLDQPG